MMRESSVSCKHLLDTKAFFASTKSNLFGNKSYVNDENVDSEGTQLVSFFEFFNYEPDVMLEFGQNGSNIPLREVKKQQMRQLYQTQDIHVTL